MPNLKSLALTGLTYDPHAQMTMYTALRSLQLYEFRHISLPVWFSTMTQLTALAMSNPALRSKLGMVLHSLFELDPTTKS